MAKARTIYVCRECGSRHPKWMGKCSACGSWNSVDEEVLESKANPFSEKTAEPGPRPSAGDRPRVLRDVPTEDHPRVPTGDPEFDRVLGGGIVPGSIVLIGGEPGIGKSTLLLQRALGLTGRTVLYVSGEESATQIRRRAERLGDAGPDTLILTETSTARIFRHIRDAAPDWVIVDSIQTLFSDRLDSTPGSVSQIRQCAGEFQRFAKETNIPVMLVGHITKEGSIAGPKVLEHIVDTVLQFEGDGNHVHRILRTIKNRFGSTAELGLYEMRSDGLRGVDNPSEMLLTGDGQELPGIAIASMVEGLRPMLVEVQALVSTAFYGTPQRSATGFDARRLNMLLAVMEKRMGYNIGTMDVFLNMAGGLKVSDPGIDLAVVSALMSSAEDRPLPRQTAFCGEVGLSGEVRPVPRMAQRLAEARKLGFDRVFVSAFGETGGEVIPDGLDIRPIHKVVELRAELFM